MNQIEILASSGDRYPPETIKLYKRKFIIECFDHNESVYLLVFNKNEMESLGDFFYQLKHQGSVESFFIHFFQSDKWIECKTFVQETDFRIRFEVYKRDKRPAGQFLEI